MSQCMMDEVLVNCIEFSLNNYLCENAIFYAERLVAQSSLFADGAELERAQLYLGLCYLQENKPNKTYEILKNCNSDKNRYILAVSALLLGRFSEVEQILYSNCVSPTDEELSRVPNGACGIYLLAVAAHRQGNVGRAVKLYRKTLELNPCIFSAYEALCKLGEDVDPQTFFSSNQTKSNVQVTSSTKTPTRRLKPASCSSGKVNTLSGSRELRSGVSSKSNTTFFDYENACTKAFQTLTVAKKLVFANESPAVQNTSGIVFDDAMIQVAEKCMPSEPCAVNREGHEIRTICAGKLENWTNNGEPKFVVNSEVMSMLCEFGMVAKNIQQYRCKEALAIVERMSERQRESPWVMGNVCRAYFELANYRDAVEVYQKMRVMAPYELKGLEYYSTILWHDEAVSELSFLAHELIEFEPNSPEAWCVFGNCFSLKKDHKSALKCFQRAIQLDPRFVYGYTLSAHEYLAQDNWFKAMESFRRAIYLDLRHYNAWYGLGIIYLRQGKLDHAAYHFKRALKINCHNPILYRNAGVVQYTSGNLDRALELLKMALKLSPDHISTEYHLSHVFLAMGRLNEAQELLEKIRDRAFKSGALALLSGRILKHKGEKSKALQEFILAQELDPNLSKYVMTELEDMDTAGRPIDLHEPPEII